MVGMNLYLIFDGWFFTLSFLLFMNALATIFSVVGLLFVVVLYSEVGFVWLLLLLL